MTDTPSDRPANACLLHRPPQEGWPWRLADQGYMTCSPCLDRLRAQLVDIGTRYRRLDATPGAQGNDGGRGAPGFGSKSPASDHVICLRDSRSSQTARMWRGGDGKLHSEDEHAPPSVWGELDSACWSIAEALDMPGPDDGLTVAEQLVWIDRRLDHATRDPVCVEVSSVVRGILTALRPVTGDPRPRKVGTCPCLVDGQPCDAPLFAPAVGDLIRCRACQAEWPREQWLALGQALQGVA